MDEDQAGDDATVQISNLSQAITGIQVPHGKDVNGFLLHTDIESVHSWIIESIKDNVKR